MQRFVGITQSPLLFTHYNCEKNNNYKKIQPILTITQKLASKVSQISFKYSIWNPANFDKKASITNVTESNTIKNIYMSHTFTIIADSPPIPALKNSTMSTLDQ